MEESDVGAMGASQAACSLLPALKRQQGAAPHLHPLPGLHAEGPPAPAVEHQPTAWAGLQA